MLNKVPHLFLDIDGVLNSIEYYLVRVDTPNDEGIDRHAITLFNLLMKEIPNLQIVISSSWRKLHTIDFIQDCLTRHGFLYSNNIVNCTPSLHTIRGIEIKHFCDQYNIVNYAIIDDDRDMLQEQLLRFVHTNGMTGITIKDVIKIIGIFNKDNELYKDLHFYATLEGIGI